MGRTSLELLEFCVRNDVRLGFATDTRGEHCAVIRFGGHEYYYSMRPAAGDATARLFALERVAAKVDAFMHQQMDDEMSASRSAIKASPL